MFFLCATGLLWFKILNYYALIRGCFEFEVASSGLYRKSVDWLYHHTLFGLETTRNAQSLQLLTSRHDTYCHMQIKRDKNTNKTRLPNASV